MPAEKKDSPVAAGFALTLRAAVKTDGEPNAQRLDIEKEEDWDAALTTRKRRRSKLPSKKRKKNG